MLCNILPTGAFTPCCRITSDLGTVKNSPLSDLWNSVEMQTLRKDILNGRRSNICGDCWQQEDRGLISERLSSGNQALTLEYKDQIVQNYQEGIVPFFEALEIRPSNACNFTCRMCHPSVSSQWHSLNREKRFYEDSGEKYVRAYKNISQFTTDLESYLPHIKTVKIHGGEPMFEPQVLEILRSLQPFKKNIWLRWVTNLSVVDHPFYNSEILKGWKKLASTVSLDGPPEVSSYIRRGQKIEAFEKNLHRLREVTKDIFFHISLQALNVLRIPQFISYAISLDPYRITFNKVETPRALKAHVLPKELRRSALQQIVVFESQLNKTALSQRLLQDIDALLNEVKMILAEEGGEAHQWQEFLLWNYKIDGELDQLFSVYPEFSTYAHFNEFRPNA